MYTFAYSSEIFIYFIFILNYCFRNKHFTLQVLMYILHIRCPHFHTRCPHFTHDETKCVWRVYKRSIRQSKPFIFSSLHNHEYHHYQHHHQNKKRSCTWFLYGFLFTFLLLWEYKQNGQTNSACHQWLILFLFFLPFRC